MKTRIFGIILTAFVAGAMSASCAKDSAVGSDCSSEKKVAYISLDAEGSASGVKSSLGADCKVSWEAGDDILYYTGCHATGATSTARTYDGSYKVPASGDAVKLPVEYLDGDNRVTILTKGRSVGAVPSPATLNSITVEDAVPASQTGTFASCYLAAAEGNLLELADGTGNLSLTPLQSYIRFKLSSLTVGDKTVNRIEIEGSSAAGGDKVCGDLVVSITEDGSHTVTVAPSSEPDALGTKITIDKTASKFNVDEYIYAALLPYEYTQLTFTLYNGTTKVASVPVIPASGTIDATQGRLVDIDAVNSHAKVAFVSAKMYPERVAITKDRSTKKLWLKIEPSDFDVNNVQWSSSDPTLATVPATGTVVTMDGIGKCIEVTVTNKYTSLYTPEKNVTITATITDPTDNSAHLSTCMINIGEWLDVGLRNENGKRVLFAHHVLYTTNGTNYSLYDKPETEMPIGQDCKYVRFPWGAARSNGIEQNSLTPNKDPIFFRWALTSSGESAISGKGQYSKYNSTDRLPHLQRHVGEFASLGIQSGTKYDTIDDPCTFWNSEANTPSTLDAANLINNTKIEMESDYYKCSGKVPGYSDTWLIVTGRSILEGDDTAEYFSTYYGFWLCEYEVGFPGMALFLNLKTLSIDCKARVRNAVYRPVKYVD